MYQWLIGFVFFVSSTFASAASFGFTPVSDDLTVKKLLSPLFGGLVGGGGADPLVAMLGVFNGALLILASLLLAYGLIAGVMQTAHDGEMLGKKWSSMWLPIRMSLGVALITPFGSGYCVIQYLVMGLVLQGIGLADTIWEKFASQSNDFVEMMVVQNREAGAKIAETVLLQQICTAVLNGEDAKLVASSNSAPSKPIVVVDKDAEAATKPAPGNALGRGAARQNIYVPGHSKYVCGSYSFPAPPPATTLNGWFGETFSLKDFSTAMSAAHKSAFLKLQTNLDTIAKGLYKENEKEVDGGIDKTVLAASVSTAVDEYNRTLATAVDAASRQTMSNDVAKAATKDGWGMAGAWYMKYLRMQGDLSAAATNFPALVPPEPVHNLAPSDKGPLQLYENIAVSIADQVRFKNENGLVKNLRKASETSGSKDKIENAIGEKFTFSAGQSVWERYSGTANGHRNPLIAAKDFGDYVFGVSVSATFALAGIVGLADSSVFGNKYGMGAAAVIAQPLLMIFTGGLVGFSAMLAFYLPLAPFIIWFGVVIGWLVMVIEAIIAAPLWAVAHIHPDGDGVVGRGGAGYSLVLALFLRPALAVLGFAVALTALDPIGTLFADTYWAAFDFAQTGSLRGPFSFAASLVIFAVMFVAIIKQVFSLIHVIPDHIMRWLGQSSNMLGGEYGKDLAHASSGGATAIGALGGGMVGKGVGAMNDRRKINSQNEANELQKQANARKSTGEALKGMKEAEESKASLQTSEGGGLSSDEATAVMNGRNAAGQAESDAVEKAHSAIESGAMGRDTASKYATAQKQGDGAEVQAILSKTVASQNEGQSVGQIGAAAADKAYKAHMASSASAKVNDSPESFSGAMQKAQTNMAAHKASQAAKTASDATGGGGSSTPEEKPVG